MISATKCWNSIFLCRSDHSIPVTMLQNILIFATALGALLVSARYFTESAEKIGKWMRLPSFVIGIFIVGIGTSLPELVSGILAVQHGFSEILPGNVIGANVSNLLLVTGMAVALYRKDIHLGSSYIYIDLHFLLGSFFLFVLIAYDGVIRFSEAWVGLFTFLVYSIYLIRGNEKEPVSVLTATPNRFPAGSLALLVLSAGGIFLGADYTVQSIADIAEALGISKSIIALTVLSIGTTLPELTVNITAIRRGKAEIALGNVLGSCIFNTLAIPGFASIFGPIIVPHELLTFSLPVMCGAGLLFYLLAQDKRISPWEGFLFFMIYLLFLLKIAGN